MNDKTSLAIFLSRIEIANSKKLHILDFLGDDPSIKKFKKGGLVENKILTAEMYNKMLLLADEDEEAYLRELAEREIYITTIFDEDYPQKLRGLNDAPVCLYYIGDLSLCDKPSISIVGSRMPSNYGKMAGAKLTQQLALAGLVIISGLAYGVDVIAHRNCLEVGGKTIAVLGCGFNNIYPPEHRSLAKEIAERGLLLSEYPPEREASKFTFPIRNRIIAGLGDGTLIVEAGLKSGTIYTKDYALDYGKNIYALPGNIDSEKSELTNDIIKRGQASLITCSEDILKDYLIDKKPQQMQMDIDGLSEDESKIISNLKKGIKSIDELTKICDLSIDSFNTCLTMLEIRGIISRLPGGEIGLN